MDRHPTPPPPTGPSSDPTAAAGSGSSVRGPTTSAMLGCFGMSSSPAHSHRRYSPSLYPPPAPTPARLPSGYGSGSSSSRFQQIPPPPAPARGRGGRPHVTHALPSPFLSELDLIRRTGASLFGALNARAANVRDAMLPALHAQQQAWPSSPAKPRLGTHLPAGNFSEFTAPPPASRQRQPTPSTGMPPLPSRSICISGPGFDPYASQQQQASRPSSSGVRTLPGGTFSPSPSPALQQPQPPSTDMLPTMPSRSFSGSAPPPWQQQQLPPSSSGMWPVTSEIFSELPSPPFQQQEQPQLPPQQQPTSFTDLAPLPGGGGIFSGFAAPASQASFTDLAPLPSGSPSLSLLSSEHGETTAFGPSWSAQLQLPPAVAAHPSSDQELHPLPPSLQQQHPPPPSADPGPLASGSLSGFAQWHGETATFGSSSSWSAPPAPGTGSNTMYGTNVQPLSDQTQLHPLPPSLQMQSDVQTPFWQPSGNDGNNSGHVQPVSSVPEIFEPGHTHTFLQVKEEPMDVQFPILEPEIIRLDEDDDEISTILQSFSSSDPASLHMLEHTSSEDRMEMGGRGSRPSELGSMLTPTPAVMYNKIDSGGSSSGGGGGTFQGSMIMSQQQAVPHQLDKISSVFVSGIAPQWQPTQDNNFSGFDQFQQALEMPQLTSSTDSLQMNINNNNGSSWAAMPSLVSQFGQMNIGGEGMGIDQGLTATQAAAVKYGLYDTTGGSSSMLSWNLFSSSSKEKQVSSPVPKPRFGARLQTRSPILGAGASSSMSQRAAGWDFTDAEIEIINKERRLKELVNTDPKSVKRILSNRASAQRLKARKTNYIVVDLQNRP